LCSCRLEHYKRQEVENQTLRAEVVELKKKLLESNKADKTVFGITYSTYEFTNRLTTSSVNVRLYPGDSAPIINEISPYTLLSVIDSGFVESKNRELWLYVGFPVYDAPMNCHGWIKESETIQHTEKNRELVRRNIHVDKDSPIYEVPSVSEIHKGAGTILNSDAFGRYQEESNGYVHVYCGGGWDFWVEKDLVQFPEVMK